MRRVHIDLGVIKDQIFASKHWESINQVQRLIRMMWRGVYHLVPYPEGLYEIISLTKLLRLKTLGSLITTSEGSNIGLLIQNPQRSIDSIKRRFSNLVILSSYKVKEPLAINADSGWSWFAHPAMRSEERMNDPSAWSQTLEKVLFSFSSTVTQRDCVL